MWDQWQDSHRLNWGYSTKFNLLAEEASRRLLAPSSQEKESWPHTSHCSIRNNRHVWTAHDQHYCADDQSTASGMFNFLTLMTCHPWIFAKKVVIGHFKAFFQCWIFTGSYLRHREAYHMQPLWAVCLQRILRNVSILVGPLQCDQTWLRRRYSYVGCGACLRGKENIRLCSLQQPWILHSLIP